MKKNLSLLCSLFACSMSLLAENPELPKKILDQNPVISNIQITTPYGQRLLTRDSGFTPTGDYTIEVKVKVDASNTRGLDLNIQDADRKGLRYAIGANGIFDYQNIPAPVALSEALNSDDFHLFRLAVIGDKVHIYRDGEFVCTQTIQAGLPKEDMMIEMDGDFETIDGLANWTGMQFGPTTAEGTVYSGTTALTLQSRNATGWFANYNINGLKPNTAYSLSYWLKFLNRNTANGNQRFDLKLGYYDESGSFVRVNGLDDWNPMAGTPGNTMDPALATWGQNIKYFHTSTNVTNAIFSICGWNGTNVKNAIDNFSLVQVSDDATYSFADENLLINGNFDDGLEGWTGNNIGQKMALSEIIGADKSLRMYTDGTAVNVVNQSGNYSQIIKNIEEGDVFQLTFDAKSTFDNVRPSKVEIEELSSTGGTLRTVNSLAIPVGDDFNSYTLQHTVMNPACKQLKVSVWAYYFKGAATGESYFDNLVLKKASNISTQPYLDYGKAFYFPEANIDIAYLNYDLSGAYAPVNIVNGLEESVQDHIFAHSENGSIIIQNMPEQATLRVYSMNGVLLYQGNKSEIALQKGCYIIDVSTSSWSKKLTIAHI